MSKLNKAKFEVENIKNAGIGGVTKAVGSYDTVTWVKIGAYALLLILVLSCVIQEQTKKNRLNELKTELHAFEKTTKHIIGSKLSPKYGKLDNDIQKFIDDMKKDVHEAQKRLRKISEPESTGEEYVKMMNHEINGVQIEKECLGTGEDDNGEFACWNGGIPKCNKYNSYYGFQNFTVTNSSCQSWDESEARWDAKMASFNLTHNYCRVMEHSLKLGYVPRCHNGTEYVECFPQCPNKLPGKPSCVRYELASNNTKLCYYKKRPACTKPGAYQGPNAKTDAKEECRNWKEAKSKFHTAYVPDGADHNNCRIWPGSGWTEPKCFATSDDVGVPAKCFQVDCEST